MNRQNRVRQRKREQRRGAENRSGTSVSASTSSKVWDTISQFHPYKNEILSVVKMLNSIGANYIIIAATLNLQKFRTFYGGFDWTKEDVKSLSKGIRA